MGFGMGQPQACKARAKEHAPDYIDHLNPNVQSSRHPKLCCLAANRPLPTSADRGFRYPTRLGHALANGRI